MWTPCVDPADPSAWGQRAPTRVRAALAPVAFVVLLALPSTDLTSSQTAVVAVLATLGWLPWRVGVGQCLDASKVEAGHAAALWMRVAPAFVLAELASRVSMRGSGWGEGYGEHASALLLLVGGALAMLLATAVAFATCAGSRHGGPMPSRVRVALALGVFVSSLGVWQYGRRPDAAGYLASLPHTSQEVPTEALAHGRLGRPSLGALGGPTTRCEIVHDTARGLNFATRCAGDMRRAVYPMRAGDLEMTPVPWSLAAHASALQTPRPALLLALLGLVSTLPMLLARRRFRARWARLDAFVDRFQGPDGALSETAAPDDVPVAVRLATTVATPGYRIDAHGPALEVIPGTVAALRGRVALVARWTDLSVIARLALTQAPAAVFLSHAVP